MLMLGPFQAVEKATGQDDKVLHAVGFGVITAGLFLNLPGWSRFQVLCAGLCLGVGVEAAQGMTGWDMDFRDVAADLAGILAVTLLWRGRRLF